MYTPLFAQNFALLKDQIFSKNKNNNVIYNGRTRSSLKPKGGF